MIFKSLLPFLCLSVLCLFFFGYFEEADDLLDPASEDQGQGYPEEVIDEFSGDIPTVTLVAENVEDVFFDPEAPYQYINFYFEVDKPLDHHLFVYYTEDFFKVFADGGSETISYKRLAAIKKGKKKSPLYYIALGESNKNRIKTSVSILPAKQRSDVALPTITYSGRIEVIVDGQAVTTSGGGGVVGVPEGHTFHPYRIGAPSEAVLVLEEEE